jgi:hypothetical protein
MAEVFSEIVSLNAAIPPWAFRFATGLPILALDLGVSTTREVLVYGALDESIATALTNDRVTLKKAPTVVDAIRTLAVSAYDGILVTPAPVDGIALVKALKLGTPIDGLERNDVRLAAQRQRVTPVFMMPLPPDDEYAVIIIAPGVAFLERADTVSVHHAITRYDYGRLPEVRGRAPLKPGVG